MADQQPQKNCPGAVWTTAHGAAEIKAASPNLATDDSTNLMTGGTRYALAWLMARGIPGSLAPTIALLADIGGRQG